MSIIYDALQKTQKNRELKIDSVIAPPPPLLSKKIRIKLMLMCLALFIVAISFFYYFKIYLHQATQPISKNIVHRMPQPTPAPLVKTSNNNLTLNGIFISANTKMVMINHQIYHLGDTIADMKIVSINQKSVRLRKGNQVLVLSM